MAIKGWFVADKKTEISGKATPFFLEQGGIDKGPTARRRNSE
jgi:hypothetical protein